MSTAERTARGWPAVAPFGPDAPRSGWKRWYQCGYCLVWTDMHGVEESGQQHPDECTPEVAEDRAEEARVAAHWDGVKAQAAARAEASLLAAGGAIQVDLFSSLPESREGP